MSFKYTPATLRKLEELGIPVDCIAGTSMGSLVGGMYAAGGSIDQLEKIVTETDWKRLFDDVGILDLETPVELVAGGFSHMRIFVGLAGWDAGQLEGELIRGSWFRASARAEEVFGTPEDLWRRTLRRLGGTAGRWSTWTETPELN